MFIPFQSFGDFVIGSVNTPKTVICNVTGAVPNATLKWILDGVDVTAKATTIVSSSGEDQTSSLTFTPTNSHHDVELKCSASNEATRRLGLAGVEQSVTFRLDPPPSKIMLYHLFGSRRKIKKVEPTNLES